MLSYNAFFLSKNIGLNEELRLNFIYVAVFLLGQESMSMHVSPAHLESTQMFHSLLAAPALITGCT